MLVIFDDVAQTAQMGDATYPHRVAKARRNLERRLKADSKSMRTIVGLG
jgi:hypothetical protein